MNGRGFTLIELVIVIILLGILSAVALPRFLDLSSDARRAVNQGVMGALSSAAVIIDAKAKLSPVSTSISGIRAVNITGSDYALISPSGRVVGVKKSGSLNAGELTIDGTEVMNDSANTATYTAACRDIFNLLVSDSSVKADITPSQTYQVVDRGTSVDGNSVDFGKCFWQRTDSLTSVPKFYIYYDAIDTGSFQILETNN